MLREQGEGGGGFSIMKNFLSKTTKEQFKLKYQNQSREQTLVKSISTIRILQLIIDASIYQFTL